ncbi:hypothetical protein EGM51_00725 [Verrucomicrobia bacterium S94]|nr:hypothetical protein EGM51_00725 [Verrucomicrobia bacterium S94]
MSVFNYKIILLKFREIIDEKQKNWNNRNIMPKFDRQLSGIIVIGLSIYLIISIANGKIYIPGKHNNGLLITGIAARVCISALFSLILADLANLINHYNKSDSKILIFYISKSLSYLSFFLFFISLFIYLFMYR